MEFNHEIFRSLGMTLVHSIWEGAIILVIVLFVSAFIRRSNAHLRYIVFFSGLVLLLTSFVVTFILIYRQQPVLQSGGNTAVSGLLPDNIYSHPYVQSFSYGFFSRLLYFIEPSYPFLAACWIIGFLLIGIRTTGAMIVTRVTIIRDLKLPDDYLKAIVDRIYKVVNLTASVRVRITDKIISPMVIGFVKPIVILPVAAISGLSTAQLEAVLVHELSHIRRLDHILILLQAIACQVLFFHPAIWFLNAEIDRERENCCDDLVMETNNNPINYIKALTMIQEMNLHGIIPANALTGKSNQFLNRIKRLVKPERKHSPAFRLTATFLFFVTVGLSVMTLIIAGKPENNQAGSIDKAILNGTVNTITTDTKDGIKKNLKIVFADDTIKEMSVNGKPVDKAEIENYEAEIIEIRQEMEASKRELEKANEKLREAQIELEIARNENENAKVKMDKQAVLEFNRQIKGAMSQAQLEMQQHKNLWQNEEFKEQMKIAQEEAKRAFEEMKKAKDEYWYMHQDEFREQMQKAQEEARKAFEELRKNIEPVPPFPPIPPTLDIEQIEIPEIEVGIPEIPHIDLRDIHEDQSVPDNSSTGSLESKLRELEEE